MNVLQTSPLQTPPPQTRPPHKPNLMRGAVLVSLHRCRSSYCSLWLYY